MKRGKPTSLRAFIASPAETRLDLLRKALSRRGVTPVTAYDLSPATVSITQNIKREIRDSDLVVAVLPNQFSANTFFELGLAHAMSKPLLVLVSPFLKQVPTDLAESFCVRAEPDNLEAISFALDQFLSGMKLQRPSRPSARVLRPVDEGQALGRSADRLLAFIREKGQGLTGEDAENVVADVLRASGVRMVSQNRIRGAGADFAVWAEELQPIIGNPLLIEVKTGVRTPHAFHGAMRQMEVYRSSSGSNWVLLIVAAAWETIAPMHRVPGVLAITLTDLLECLRTRSFIQVIRDLRNEHVHGGRY